MKQLLLLIAVALTVQANADNYRDMEPLKRETPEMKVELAPTASPAMELVTRWWMLRAPTSSTSTLAWVVASGSGHSRSRTSATLPIM